MPTAARRALIAGLGLIGGSIGIALRRRGWHVLYLDPYVDDPREAADERVHELAPADLTILATPVDVALRLIAADRRTTSTCSVMQPLRAIGGEQFIAGHPLAGSEQRGLDAARGDLFAGKHWFVDREDPLVLQAIADCEAIPEVVTAEEHDRVMALTSHLPQVLSTALGALLADEDPHFLGTGAKTFLRLAGSEASVWAPVLAANRGNIRAHFERFVEIARAVIEDDPEAAFGRARQLWKELSAE